MSENPTPDEVRASIVPKSDQLNADDLLTGPLTVTVTKVSRGDREQPIVVELEGQRPFKPCKTTRRILIAAWTDDAKKWVGQRMTLFCDPEVMWGGVKVGGIRISHLSGLENPRTFMLTKTRGKREEVTVQPIAQPPRPILSPDDEEHIKAARNDLAAVQSLEDLKNVGEILATMSDAVRAAMRPVYAKRKKELET